MIFHISSVYPPKLGGLEKVVEVLAKTQKRMGNEVAVITSDEDSSGTEIPSDGFTVTRLKSFILASTTIMPMLIFRLLKLRKDDIAHVHVARAYTPEMVWIASRFKRFEYIAHLHLDVPPSGPAGFLLKPYKNHVLKRVLQASKFVIVFTDDQKTDVIKKYGIDPARVKIIPNGVEDKFYYDKKRTLHKKPHLLFVGRLGYQKNIQQLLRALDGISDQFETVLVGDGEQEQELKHLTKELNLQNVKFVGRKDDDELLDYYKAADIFVLSSEREGMPLVLLEAMAMGLPVIATNVTGSRDIIENGKNGLLVPYEDADAFRKALLKIKSDKKLYETMSQMAYSLADQYSWEKVATKFEKLYKEKPLLIARAAVNFKARTKTGTRKSIYLWALILPLLATANLAYLPKDFFGWVITLGFFMVVPGYLLLGCLEHGIKSRLEIACFSLGLSLLILMIGGLTLNSLHTLGLARPLTTLNIFVMLDTITIALLVLNKNKHIKLPSLELPTNIEQIVVSLTLTLLPLLAVGGAIRLNNGASNILTMVLFVTIPAMFIYLVARKKLRSLYPYAIFTFGLAALFSTSLRGWFITGHDIQHEFRVFHSTYVNGFWAVGGYGGDPYNACLSITILPTIFAKITTISAPYIYKAVFQVIFAFGLLPIYQIAKRFSNETLAMIAAFVFITFPTYLDDMPFLNRQEIGFIFFGLLILATFREMRHKTKSTLTILLLFGLILSHYSSGYTALLLLLLGWCIYHLFMHKRVVMNGPTVPALRLSIILAALLFTFLWNAQITTSTSNLRGTITQTAKSLLNHTSSKDGFVQYSLLNSAGTQQSPAQVLKSTAKDKASEVQYVPWPNLPVTRVGEEFSHITNIEVMNYRVHMWEAKIFQILLLGGVIILVVRERNRRTHEELYFYALTISCTIMLILWTVLPQISIDYTPIRLFQQTLVITALPMVFAAEFLFSYLGRYKIYLTSIVFAVLFLDLSGFIPQSTGGYLPQLSTNNYGAYYDFFYSHKSDAMASQWIANNREGKMPVYMDTNSSTTLTDYPVVTGYNNLLNYSQYGYLYQGYINTNTGNYRVFLNTGMVEFRDSSLLQGRNLIYNTQGSRIFSDRSIQL